MLKITPKAVEFHRLNIPKKIRISCKNMNLEGFFDILSCRH